MKNQQQEEEKPAKRAAADKPVDREGARDMLLLGAGAGVGAAIIDDTFDI